MDQPLEVQKFIQSFLTLPESEKLRVEHHISLFTDVESAFSPYASSLENLRSVRELEERLRLTEVQ